MPKYKTLTLQQKFCLIQEPGKNTCSKAELAERHNVLLWTLSTILKNNLKVLEAYSKTYSSKRSRVRAPTYQDDEDVKSALLCWLQKANAAHLPVSGTILREEADLTLQLGHEEFKCSNGWLSHFKECNN
ncbi:tigger transposable element-derived protein 4-like [Dermacentor albipictus]|uniref:tigger transposable element-derived protein 4-like n=1 Tax=Dermacentor albipictus TaxID=60249 RepID=UPI0038FCBFA6